MEQILDITLAGVLLSFFLIPFFIVIRALFPARLAKTSDLAGRLPRRAFAIGMVNFLFFLVIALVLFSVSDNADGVWKALLMLPALSITLVLLLALSFGLGSMANLLGERVAPTHPAWRQTLWGTLLGGLACTVPFVGWFLLLPYLGWVGMGALITSFFRSASE